MIDLATSNEELLEAIKKQIERLGKELKEIDEKIDPVIEEQENQNAEDPLYRANLELKQSYIEQGKMAALIEAFVSVEQMLAAFLELSVKQAAADAAEAAAKAARDKQLADAEMEAKKLLTDAKAAEKKGEADAEAAKEKAEAIKAAAQAKAEADAKAAAAKKKADSKKAEQDAHKALAAALAAAAAAFKGTAESISAVKEMKDDLEKEIQEKS
ncbi:MAG: hypothetical protein IH897_09520 [Planctomycetes bacterium]|nr:hypothetical protein [Planctomycetota bacterium]